MDKQSMKDLILSSAAYSLSSILGPLLLFGVPAYFLDKYFNTKPLLTLVAVFIAFLVTNVLLFKKVTKINQMIAKEAYAAKKANSKDSQDQSVDRKL
jgi:F0F1-type ATP synthase assembly protein I